MSPRDPHAEARSRDRRPRRPLEPTVPTPAEATRRQELAALLAVRPFGFEELRRQLRLPARVLEEELRHLRRTLGSRGQELRVEPAACEACGFVFRDREALRTPTRCPRCKEERVLDPRFHLEEGGGRGR